MESISNCFDFVSETFNKTGEYWFDFYSSLFGKININEIPLINNKQTSQIPNDQQIIRFRGMISNQFSPEYYFSQCAIKNNENTDNDTKEKDVMKIGMYQENIEIDKTCEIDSNNVNTKINERIPMLLLNPPNQTSWIQNEEEKIDINQKSNTFNKCIAKFYCHASLLKICDVIDIYGILRLPSNDETSHNEPDEDNKFDIENDSFKGLPCIHVIYWKKVEHYHPEIIPPNDNDNIVSFNKMLNEFRQNVENIRSSLINFILTFVNDDKLAAEYILLQMVSQIIFRNCETCIGSLSVNLFGFPSNDIHCELLVKQITQLYHLLLPYVLNIDITIDNLNSARLVPIKNLDSDVLELQSKHNLQFVEGTHVILNETPLTSGQLNNTGVLNIQALNELITKQKISYDFKFHQFPFDTNCSIIVLAKSKSMPELKCDVDINLNLNVLSNIVESNEEINDENEENQNNSNRKDITMHEVTKRKDSTKQISSEQLNEWRKYIAIARLISKRFSLQKNTRQVIEEDFVNILKKNHNSNENTLHSRLTLLRLMNASFLKEECDCEMLKKMQDLENQRLLRNQKSIKK